MQDSKIVQLVEKFISDELDLVNAKNRNEFLPPKERFLVFKQAFIVLMDHLKVYRNLISKIKQKYDLSISDLEVNAFRLQMANDSFNKMFDNTLTITNLIKRQHEMNKRLDLVLGENIKLKEEYSEIKKLTSRFVQSSNSSLLSGKLFDSNDQPVGSTTKTRDGKNLVNEISLDKATDIDYLENLMKRIETKIDDLNRNQDKKFFRKEAKAFLYGQIFEKSTVKELAQQKCKQNRRVLLILNNAYQIIIKYYDNKLKSYSCVEEALIKNLINFCLINKSYLTELENDALFNDFDMEADLILDFIEKFNDLLDKKQFVDAANLASMSPKNILRNIETFHRFKMIRDEFDLINKEKEDPLLAFCIALVESNYDEYSKPNRELSNECIRIVLSYNKIDNLTSWIYQKKLTLSVEAANQIKDYALLNSKSSKESFELALYIYSELNHTSIEMFVCLANLGRMQHLNDLLKMHQVDIEVCLNVLYYCPKIDLANIITSLFKSSQTESNIQLIECITGVLLDFNPNDGLRYLKTQFESFTDLDEKGREKLKASYEMLKKHSYLMQEEDLYQ